MKIFVFILLVAVLVYTIAILTFCTYKYMTHKECDCCKKKNNKSTSLNPQTTPTGMDKFILSLGGNPDVLFYFMTGNKSIEVFKCEDENLIGIAVKEGDKMIDIFVDKAKLLSVLK